MRSRRAGGESDVRDVGFFVSTFPPSPTRTQVSFPGDYDEGQAGVPTPRVGAHSLAPTAVLHRFTRVRFFKSPALVSNRCSACFRVSHGHMSHLLLSLIACNRAGHQ
jgi:hypothetical protein